MRVVSSFAPGHWDHFFDSITVACNMQTTVMMKLDDIIKQEKKSGSIPQKFDAKKFQKKNSLMLVKAFYDGITDYYAHAEENTQFEEWIVRRMIFVTNVIVIVIA